MRVTPGELALEYADLRIAVFPVDPRDKKPLIKDHLRKASTDPQIITAWWAQYPNAMVGIPTGATQGVVVIDLDRRDSDGRDGVARFAESFEGCQTPVRSRTAGNGVHLFYRHPGIDLKVTSKPLAGPQHYGIDVRGDNAYIIAPGSARADGSRYTWDDQTDSETTVGLFGFGCLPELPEKLRAALDIRTLASLTAPPPQTCESDTQIVIDQCLRYLTSCPPATAGEYGNLSTYKVAATLKDYGASAGMAFALLSEHYNPRCNPPWEGTALQTIVSSAYRNGTQTPGCRSIENFKPEELQPVENATTGTRIAPKQGLSIDWGEPLVGDGINTTEAGRSVGDHGALVPGDGEEQPARTGAQGTALLKLVGAHTYRGLGGAPRLKYLVKGLLRPASVGLIYGPSGSGKSFIALDLAHAVVSKQRTEWHGHKIRRTETGEPIGPAIIFAAEGGGGFPAREEALIQHWGDDPGSLPLFIRPGPIDMRSDDGERAAWDVIKAIGQYSAPQEEKDNAAAGGREVRPVRPALIIFDTLSQIMAGGDENSSGDMSALMQRMAHIALVTGACVILIHHPGKDASRGARGHSSLHANVDFEFEILSDHVTTVGHTEGGNWGEAKMVARKQKDGELCAPILLQIKVVTIGKDEDGDNLTSCVVVGRDAPALTYFAAEMGGGNSQEAQAALGDLPPVVHSLLASFAACIEAKGAATGEPLMRVGLTRAEWGALDGGTSSPRKGGRAITADWLRKGGKGAVGALVSAGWVTWEATTGGTQGVYRPGVRFGGGGPE